jgi:DNA-binding NtrC family response regulator
VTERVLIVDDDPVHRRLMENMVSRFGYQAVTATGGEAALALLLGQEGAPFDCVVLDLVMPDLDGLGVLGRLRQAGLTIPVIVETAHGGLDNVVSAMRAGAVDFVVKPVGPERLQVSLRNALAASALEGELARLKRSRSGNLGFKDIITRSDVMRAALRMAEKAAASTIPVLIEGESGVGKELVARAIHGSGERRAKPFVAVNCGAIPENLVESTLFGHEKGAFTGATERHSGKFLEASGGTLFLDEVGELPSAAQVKLLRALQEGEVEPVGGRRPIKVDVRVISATNRDLSADVRQGRFREDLFYRLHVFPIMVPPLRHRPEDIPDLARHFQARFAAEEGKRVRAIRPDAVSLLSQYQWPGNVRQLENAVFRAVVLAEGDMLGLDEFPQIAAQVCSLGSLASLAPTDPVAQGHAAEPADSPLHMGRDGDLARAAFAPIKADDRGMLALLDAQGEVRPLEEIEAELVRFAIDHYRGQMSEVARRLRIGRSTLYRKLEGLSAEAAEGEPLSHLPPPVAAG